MHAGSSAGARTSLWVGYILSALVTLFLLFDAGVKVLNLPVAVEATVRLGYPKEVLLGIGLAELISVILYVVPRTSILGAILLTGHLGGATATQVRVQDSGFWFPVLIGVLAWGALYLRDAGVRVLIPLRGGRS